MKKINSLINIYNSLWNDLKKYTHQSIYESHAFRVYFQLIYAHLFPPLCHLWIIDHNLPMWISHNYHSFGHCRMWYHPIRYYTAPNVIYQIRLWHKTYVNTKDNLPNTYKKSVHFHLQLAYIYGHLYAVNNTSQTTSLCLLH